MALGLLLALRDLRGTVLRDDEVFSVAVECFEHCFAAVGCLVVFGMQFCGGSLVPVGASERLWTFRRFLRGGNLMVII